MGARLHQSLNSRSALLGKQCCLQHFFSARVHSLLLGILLVGMAARILCKMLLGVVTALNRSRQ